MDENAHRPSSGAARHLPPREGSRLRAGRENGFPWGKLSAKLTDEGNPAAAVFRFFRINTVPIDTPAISNRCPHFYKITIRIIETYDLLSPTVHHESIHILDFRIVTFQFFNKSFYIRFLKI